jgi:hypothetical protein
MLEFPDAWSDALAIGGLLLSFQYLAARLDERPFPPISLFLTKFGRTAHRPSKMDGSLH